MNALKRWIVRKEVEGFVDNAIKESQMSDKMKSYLIGLVNAGISGAAVGGSGAVLGIGWKKDLLMLAFSAAVSMGKWMVQHPIPGGAQ